MIRVVGSAAAVGALLALACYGMGWQAPSAWLGAEKRVTAEAADDWPLCTTMASLAEAADWAELDVDFAAGKRALAAGHWNEAIAALKLASLRDPENADIQNYIGYAYGRLRQTDSALAHFRRALVLNPRHRGAREHLGESYLMIGDVDEAKRHLAALEGICLLGCQEHADLQLAIASYQKTAGR